MCEQAGPSWPRGRPFQPVPGNLAWGQAGSNLLQGWSLSGFGPGFTGFGNGFSGAFNKGVFTGGSNGSDGGRK